MDFDLLFQMTSNLLLSREISACLETLLHIQDIVGVRADPAAAEKMALEAFKGDEFMGLKYRMMKRMEATQEAVTAFQKMDGGSLPPPVKIKKQQEIRESVVRFEKFVKEKDAKKARALKKERDELASKKQKEIEIQSLRQELEQLEAKKEEFSTLLDKLIVYEQFLETTLETVEDFQEIDDILMRNATLMASNQDLADVTKSCAEETDEYRQRLASYTKEMESRVLADTSKIAQFQKSTDRLKFENTKLDELQQYRERAAVDKKRDLGQALMAIHNIFHRCKKKGIAPLTSESPEELWRVLNYIGQRVQDLGDIANEKP